ncbi:MAG: NADP-dependent oxidoreductase [Myxococcota bacterium]
MSDENRQWLLRSRPVAMVKESDFELRTGPIPKPDEGQMLVRTRWLSFEPAMRGWMEDRPNYIPPVGIGEVMRGVAVGEVVESRLEGFAPGDLVSGMTGWQEWALAGPGVRKLAPGSDPRLELSVLGITGITAYFGLLDIGEPREGDVVVVSGAAGATGSVVGQIAKLSGCFVVGIAGGEAKCAWLTDEAHFDAAIDYKREDVGRRLDELCPGGIDVFFDNVGGETLDDVLARIARGARIVVCGAITRYSLEELPPGPRHYINIMIQRAKMQGFVVLDYAARFGEATEALSRWVADGRIAWEVDVQHGFENAPGTLRRLYTGANFGKQLLEC